MSSIIVFGGFVLLQAIQKDTDAALGTALASGMLKYPKVRNKNT